MTPGAKPKTSKTEIQALLKIYNTLTHQKEEFQPIEPGKIRMYVCGLTTYDYSHIGHARMLVAFDVIVRYLRASGFDVTTSEILLMLMTKLSSVPMKTKNLLMN